MRKIYYIYVNHSASLPAATVLANDVNTHYKNRGK